MELHFAKVLDSRRKTLVGLKRNKAARIASYLSRVSRNNVSRYSALKASSLKLGKRKKPEICETKCWSYDLPRYYTNFMKTAVPKRLMFYQNGGWVDHDSEIVDMAIKEFEHKKAAVEVKLSGHHLIFDFVRMVQFDFVTALELPMAWIDEDGGCFFPEVHNDANEYGCDHYKKQKEGSSSVSVNHGVKEIKLQIEIELNSGDTKVLEYCGETSPRVKRFKVCQNAEVEDSCDKISDMRANEDVGENQGLKKEVDAGIEKACLNVNAETVKEMFLAGMNVVDDVNAVGIGSNYSSMWEGRLELFLKQVEITRKLRGNANVSYAWLRSSKEASSTIMTYGLGHIGLQQIKCSYGVGLHLTAASCANTSANYCDVDENGIRYMVLCRVILGNMEVVPAGSKQFRPSNENYDTGVDDLQNPRHFVVWSMNINTHLYPEYVVSFRVPTNCEGSVLKNDHKHEVFGVKPVTGFPITSKVGAEIDLVSDHQSNITCDGSNERASSSNSTAVRAPQSPWMPFPVLFAEFSKHVPSSDMKLVLENYEQLKNKAINRQSFVKNLRLIVGDTILRSAIMELNRKVASKYGISMLAENQETAG